MTFAQAKAAAAALGVQGNPSSVMVNNFVSDTSGTCSAMSQTSQSRRISRMERKISVASIMSDDSYIGEAGRSLGAAIGFSRVGSVGPESRRRNTLMEDRRISVMSSAIADHHLSTVTSSNNVEEILNAEDLPRVNTFRIFMTNAQEWHYILFGSLASVVMGASMPVYAILFGEVNTHIIRFLINPFFKLYRPVS